MMRRGLTPARGQAGRNRKRAQAARSRPRVAGKLALLAFALAAAIAPSSAGAASTAHTALLNAQSVTVGDGIEKEGTPISLEQYAAERAGFEVTVASGTEWEEMTA